MAARTSWRRMRAAVAGCVVGCAALATLTTVPAAAGGSAGVIAAHLRFTVTTTSDWSQVHVSSGRVVAHRLVKHTGSGVYTSVPDGLSLHGMTGLSTFVIDVVLYDPSRTTSYTWTVCKGYLGTTTVRVTNLNAATPSSVATVTDSVHNPTNGRNPRMVTVSRDAVMTSTPMSLPRADARRLVLAFYYPWFADYSDPRLADRPTHPRSVYRARGVASMTAQAKAHGVDGFVVSWMGDKHTGEPFDLAVRAARAQHQKITGYLETAMATSAGSLGRPDPRVVRRWLLQLLRRSSSSAFLRASDHDPVVFVYTMHALPAKKWRNIVAAVDDDLDLSVHLVGDTLDPSYLPLEYGVHRYSAMSSPAALRGWSRRTSLALRGQAALDPAVGPHLFVGTVQPGFDDRKLRGSGRPVIRRDDGTRYDRTWSAALAGSPDWIVATSWNEWFEDTEIEPGVATGATALTRTLSWSRTFKHRSGPAFIAR